MRAFRRPELLPIAEAASRLGCSVRTLQRFAREGRISYVRRGRFAFVLREDLARLEVGGRTDWLVARLADAAGDSMRVAEWFRHWIELQRIACHPSPEHQIQWEVVAAEHVIEQHGERSMAEYGVGDLAEALNSSGLPPEAALGLRILSRGPSSTRLLDAYRDTLRSLLGWQPQSRSQFVQDGRSPSTRLDARDNGRFA